MSGAYYDRVLGLRTSFTASAMSSTYDGMEFSVPMGLPGGITFDDVTALFEQAAKGEIVGSVRRARELTSYSQI